MSKVKLKKLIAPTLFFILMIISTIAFSNAIENLNTDQSYQLSNYAFYGGLTFAFIFFIISFQHYQDQRSIEKAYSQTKIIDETKSQFVTIASHQLRTPLTAIKWYAELLLTGGLGNLNDNQKEYLQELFHASEKMAELIDALLNVSRIEMGTFSVNPEPVNLASLIQEELKELSMQIQDKNFKFSEKYDQTIPLINLDVNLTKIIIQNILSNAVKYTKEGGEISINLRLTKNSSKILFSVKDTGYGIPEDQQSKIFTKLFRADNIKQLDTQGTGLGLYVIKSILETFNGKIWFESTENIGSTFFIEIPITGMPKKEGKRKLTPQKHFV